MSGLLTLDLLGGFVHDRETAALDAGLAVTHALRPADREAILRAWGPTVDGRCRTVAEVLHSLDDLDAQHAWTDPYMNGDGMRLHAVLSHEDEHPPALYAWATAYAVQARALLEQGVPTDQSVERLVRAALARHEGR